jgi:hypothetical protein
MKGPSTPSTPSTPSATSAIEAKRATPPQFAADPRAPMRARGVRRAPVPRWLAGALVVLVCALLALRESASEPAPELEPEVSPLPVLPHGCRAQGADALAQASALEQVAKARWERVPFALREAPRAIVQLAEAESCFLAANDRVGRMRSAATRRIYENELARRFARARLLLRVAMRAGARHPQQRRDAQLLGIQTQVARLLALLDRAPPSAAAYRAELEQLARSSAAERGSRVSREENSP